LLIQLFTAGSLSLETTPLKTSLKSEAASWKAQFAKNLHAQSAEDLKAFDAYIRQAQLPPVAAMFMKMSATQVQWHSVHCDVNCCCVRFAPYRATAALDTSTRATSRHQLHLTTAVYSRLCYQGHHAQAQPQG
jgi:hypothetical protein